LGRIRDHRGHPLSPKAKLLKFSTKGAMHKPITFEVDGKTYEVTRLNRALFEKAQKLEAEVAKGKVGALYEQLALLTTAPAAVLGEMDIRDVRDLLSGIRERVIKGEPEEEKNESKAGEPPAA